MTAIENVAKSIVDLGNEPLIEGCNGDPAALLVLLDYIRTSRQALHTIEAAVEAAAANAMTGKRLELGGFVAERNPPYTYTKWENAQVADRLVAQVCTDPDSGELDPEAYHVGRLVTEALLDCAAVDRWRVTKLRAAGIRYDDACEKTLSRRTIRILRSTP